MKLVFIHGAPGSGKLTTARALLDRFDGRLFDNHAAIDVARTILEFDAPGFWELVHDVRLCVLDAAARNNVPLVVMTFVYADPDDAEAFLQFESRVEQSGGQVLPVFLDCSVEELARRADTPERAARGKLTSADSIRDMMSNYKIGPVSRISCLRLDSKTNSADQNAIAIIRHFELAP